MSGARDKPDAGVWHEHWWEKLLPQWGALGDALGRFEGANLRSRYNIAWHAMHQWHPCPPSLQGLTDNEIEERYVIGNAAPPDLAAAEFVIHLQRKRLCSWVCDATDAALKLTDVAKRDPRRVAANRKWAIVAMFADGDYTEPSELADRIAAALDRDPGRAQKYGLFAPTEGAKRKRRGQLKNIVRNMVAAAKADPEFGDKVWLTVEEFEMISRDFRAEGGETKRMRCRL